MNKIYVGIDISKEQCNLCFRSGLEIVREEECSNDVKALKKAFKVALKVLGASAVSYTHLTLPTICSV